jgi:multicomponent Na+:H+ antiporter subunit D
MGSVASCFIFMGIAFLYGFASTLNMADMARVLSYKQGNLFLPFIGVLFLMGFGLKAALMPFHAWLPDAHSSAPAPVSAMLSGVLIKALGIYAIVRIFFNILGTTQIFLSALMFLSVISIIISGILSVSQWNLKRLMAYSSIGQIGYILLGIGLGTPLGIFGALFHLLNHSVMKSLLFLTAGSIDYAGGGKDLREMQGIGRQMPFTSKMNLIASMAVSGVPPFAGFFSKLIIIVACLQKGHIGYGFCAVIGSIFTLSAFMKARKFAFLGETKDNSKSVKDVPWLMKFSMVFLALFCVIGGLMLLPGMRFFINDAVQVVVKGTNYSSIILEAVLK